jgi:hypothetical protein
MNHRNPQKAGMNIIQPLSMKGSNTKLISSQPTMPTMTYHTLSLGGFGGWTTGQSTAAP